MHDHPSALPGTLPAPKVGSGRRIAPGAAHPAELGAPPVVASQGASIVAGRTERCQGRTFDGYRGRGRPCSRRPMIRVTGTHGLTADLCSQHARGAIDRPQLIRGWLDQAGAGRADARGLRDGPLSAGPPAPLARVGGQRRPEAGTEEILQVAAELAAVAVVRAALSRALRGQGWSEELHRPVLMAVGEALANAVEHGSVAGGGVEVGLTVTSERACVRVADEGRLGASMPLGPPVSPRAESPRGRGRLVMLDLAENVEVRSGGEGTSVLLTFVKPGRRPEVAAASPE